VRPTSPDFRPSSALSFSSDRESVSSSASSQRGGDRSSFLFSQDTSYPCTSLRQREPLSGGWESRTPRSASIHSHTSLHRDMQRQNMEILEMQVARYIVYIYIHTHMKYCRWRVERWWRFETQRLLLYYWCTRLYYCFTPGLLAFTTALLPAGGAWKNGGGSRRSENRGIQSTELA
jgi:hypothetical protein